MFGLPLQYFATLDSTNRYALEWVDAPHGGAVQAGTQTAGRGRLGRSWSSPEGRGLYLSVVLRRPLEIMPLLSLATALAVVRALKPGQGVGTGAVGGASVGGQKEVAGTFPLVWGIKWPNDVLVKDAGQNWKKVGGILCESAADATGYRLVVGLGLNLNHREEDLPERPVFPATSLYLLTGRETDARSFAARVLTELSRVDADLAHGETGPLCTAINHHLAGVGQVATVEQGAQRLMGMVRGVDENGRLQLATASGVVAVVAGDVKFL